MLRATFLFTVLGAAGAQQLPPPDVPGATNPAVTQATIKQTICKHGWTKTVRPPVSETDAAKANDLLRRHLPGKLADFEWDHKVPLELGGHPSDPRNLWNQPYLPKPGARQKDVIETRLNRMVCAGQITLDAAQEAISKDWWAAYQKYGKKK